MIQRRLTRHSDDQVDGQAGLYMLLVTYSGEVLQATFAYIFWAVKFTLNNWLMGNSLMASFLCCYVRMLETFDVLDFHLTLGALI